MTENPERRQRNILVAIALAAALATMVLLFFVLMRTQSASTDLRTPPADAPADLGMTAPGV